MGIETLKGFKINKQRTFLESNCLMCGTLFTHNKITAKYCSLKCANSHSSKSSINFRKSSVENSLLSVLWGAKSRSKRRKVEFDISDKYILDLLEKQNGKCAATGITLEPSKQNGFKSKNPFTVSIDRIDNNKGYIKDNVQLVCTIFNLCKNSYEMKDVIKMCKEFIKYNNICLKSQQ